MRKALLMSFIAGIFSVGISACNGKNEEKKSETIPAEQQTTDTYACPMKCSEKTFDKSGKCPECEMDMEKINPS